MKDEGVPAEQEDGSNTRGNIRVRKKSPPLSGYQSLVSGVLKNVLEEVPEKKLKGLIAAKTFPVSNPFNESSREKTKMR